MELTRKSVPASTSFLSVEDSTAQSLPVAPTSLSEMSWASFSRSASMSTRAKVPPSSPSMASTSVMIWRAKTALPAPIKVTLTISSPPETGRTAGRHPARTFRRDHLDLDALLLACRHHLPRSAGIGDDAAYPLYRGHPHHGYVPELGVIREDDDLLGRGHHVAVALDLEHVVGRKPVVHVYGRAAHEELVRAQVVQGVLRQRPEHGELGVAQDAAGDHGLDVGERRQQRGYVETVGNHGNVPRRPQEGNHLRGRRTAVYEDHVSILHVPRRSPPETSLLRYA